MTLFVGDVERVKDQPVWVMWRVTAAFKALRKLGYIARQNYTCCRSCAGAGIANDVMRFSANRQAKLLGAVYYHRQDGEAYNRPRMGELAIRYGQVHTNGKVYGKPEKEIGQDVVQALRAQGLYVEWDGDPGRVIMVLGLDQTVLDAARATVRLGGHYEDVLNNRASGR